MNITNINREIRGMKSYKSGTYNYIPCNSFTPILGVRENVITDFVYSTKKNISFQNVINLKQNKWLIMNQNHNRRPNQTEGFDFVNTKII